MAKRTKVGSGAGEPAPDSGPENLGPSLRARQTLRDADAKVEALREKPDITLHDLNDLLGDIVSALEDIRYELYQTQKSMDFISEEALDANLAGHEARLREYSTPRAAPGPRQKGKRRKKKSDPNIVIGCGTLFLLVVVGLIFWGAWKSITGTP